MYGVEAVGPTELQRLTLICAVEALLKEGQPSGVTGLIKQGPLGDGLMKEFHAFHASLLCWPNLLDLPSSVQQVQQIPPLSLCHPALALTCRSTYTCCTCLWGLPNARSGGSAFARSTSDSACSKDLQGLPGTCFLKCH